MRAGGEKAALKRSAVFSLSQFRLPGTIIGRRLYLQNLHRTVASADCNAILRLKRIEAHQVFDAYWQKMHISRTKAYQWLARELKFPEEDTHIGGFEIDTCQRVIDLCRAKMDKK